MLSIISVAYSLLILGLIKESKPLHIVLYLSLIGVMSCLLYLFMDAPDVALTEAALGSALSTAVLIFASKGIKEQQLKHNKYYFLLLLLIFIMISYICWGMFDYGSSDTMLHKGVSKYYIENTYSDIKIPETVAAVLASYRGLDTLFETSVIFIACICIYLIKKLGDEK